MNTFEDAFKIAIEKHLSKKNRIIESGSLHPLNLIEMLANRKEDKVTTANEFSMSAGEATGKMGNSTPGVSG